MKLFVIFLLSLVVCVYNSQDKINKINLEQQKNQNNNQSQILEEQPKKYKTPLDHHECMHTIIQERQNKKRDELEKLQKERVEQEEQQTGKKRRNLAAFQSPWTSTDTPDTANIAPIRITYNTDFLNTMEANKQISGEQKKFIVDQLEVAKAFYEKRIQVVPIVGNNEFNSYGGVYYQCVDAIVKSPDDSTGIPNSDFHMYVTAEYASDQAFLAWASYCQQEDVDGGRGRPTFAQVHYNTYYLTKLNDATFAQSMETTLHEIAHAMVFSPGDSGLFGQFRKADGTGQYYEGSQGLNGVVEENVMIRGLSTNIMITPKVRQWTEEHFGCTLGSSGAQAGLQLENQGASGSKGAHWERTILYDEVMTASRFGPSKTFSGATLAIFEDSGWYVVNKDFEEKLMWGYKKGCDFLVQACQANSGFHGFDEFCDVAGETKCTGGREGKGVCIKDNLANYFMDADCGIVNPYGNAKCIDSENSSADFTYTSSGQTYQYIGENNKDYDARCFESTYDGGQAQCYRYGCNPDKSLEIFIRNTDDSYNTDTVKCFYKGQQIIGKAGKTGTFTCPDPDTFCNQGRNFCKSWCSSNGYCSDGVCVCKWGYGGDDCTTEINTTTNCGIDGIDSDKFLQNDESACVDDCCAASGNEFCDSYENMFNRKCQSCHEQCDTCIGGGSNSCLSCTGDLKLNVLVQGANDIGNCVTQCPDGKFDNGANKCQDCDIDCATCINAGSCTSCKDNKKLIVDLTDPDQINDFEGSCAVNCRGSDFEDLEAKQCFDACPKTREIDTINQQCNKCDKNPQGLEEFMNTALRKCVTADQCPSKTFPDRDQFICDTCNAKCQECFDGGENSCKSCPTATTDPQTYLFGNKCLEAHSCPEGSYAENTTFKCTKCDDQCSRCVDSADKCLECTRGRYFNNDTQKCVLTEEECPARTFADKILNNCTPCHANCLTCSKENIYHCQSCDGNVQEHKFLILGVKQTCESKCPNGTYSGENNFCQNCHFSCATCSGKLFSECSICIEGYYLHTDPETSTTSCLFKCPNYYYGVADDNKIQTCQICDSSCLKCVGPTNKQCTKCDLDENGKQLYLNSGLCVSKCPDLLPADEITMECFASINTVFVLVQLLLICFISII